MEDIHESQTISKKICEKCKIIKRKGRVMVICENRSTSSARADARDAPLRQTGFHTHALTHKRQKERKEYLWRE